MKNWGKHFGLVEIRKKAAQEVWDNASAYTLLTGEVVIRTENFSALPPWEKAEAWAAAVGLTVDTAVVAGKSAGRLGGSRSSDGVKPWSSCISKAPRPGRAGNGNPASSTATAT